MKIINLTEKSEIYTSNVYLVLGNWNTLDDLNTLVDVGRDPSVIERLKNTWTGVGKHKVDQVILTHNHYDHVSLLPRIRTNYAPQVYAFSDSLKGVDHLLEDGQILRLGDRTCEIIHTPGHSSDSICIYCEQDNILLAGDTPLIINSTNGSYDRSFVEALEKICSRDIQAIYPGHGMPLLDNCNKRLSTSLTNVKKSIIYEKQVRNHNYHKKKIGEKL